MANYPYDIIRLEATEASLPTILRAGQLGFANDTFVLGHKSLDGVTMKYWSADAALRIFEDIICNNLYAYDTIGIGTTSPVGTAIFHATDVSNFVILSDGRTGIGTTAPDELLHVYGDIVAQTDLHVRNNTHLTEDLNVQNGDVTVTTGYVKLTNGNLIVDSGNVGIGTNNPNEGKLQIPDAGSSLPNIILGTLATGSLSLHSYQSGHAYNEIKTGVNENLVLTTQGTGNVGIGVTDPTHLFSVVNGAPFSAEINIGDDGTELTGSLILGDISTTTKHVGIWRGAANSYSSGGYCLNLGAYNDIVFAASSDEFGSQTERMRILGSNGNIGINDTSPSDKLSINSTSEVIAGFYRSAVKIVEIPFSGTSKLNIYEQDGGNVAIALVTDNDNGIIQLNNTGAIKVQLSSTGNSYFNATGNVGVGITNPSSKLHILNSGATSGVIAAFRNDGANAVTDVNIINDAQTWGFRVDGGNNDNFVIRDYQNTKDVMSFVKSTGNVGIGTTNPGYLLEVEDSQSTSYVAYFNNTYDGTTAHGVKIECGDESTGGFANLLLFTRTGGDELGKVVKQGAAAVLYSTTSDKRFKENIVNINEDKALKIIKKIKPRHFNFKKENKEKIRNGFIAQELIKWLPEAVSGNENQVNEKGNIVAMGIDYGMLTPILTTVTKNLLKRIEVLEKKLKGKK